MAARLTRALGRPGGGPKVQRRRSVEDYVVPARRATILVALLLVMSGCDGPSRGQHDSAWTVFAPEGRVDYQLGGAYPPGDDVVVLVRDRADSPVDGLYNICYVNGFQTQPDESQIWLEDHPTLVLRDASGEPVRDPSWPDEYVLDTRTPENRAQIADIVGEQISTCMESGYQAVDVDNLDTGLRFDELSIDDNLALAQTLIGIAHDAGLAIGQKNAAEIGERGPAVGFDFVVSEQCAIYNECEVYAAQYGDRHIDVEYVDDLTADSDFADLCKTAHPPSLTVLRDLQLVSSGEPGYRYQHC